MFPRAVGYSRRRENKLSVNLDLDLSIFQGFTDTLKLEIVLNISAVKLIRLSTSFPLICGDT